jgi:SAM-dependent methyltransferase
MREAGSPLRRDMRVLDFGAGWGRFYRLLMRELSSVVAVDPDQSCIDLCRDLLPGGDFLEISPRPPYKFNDNEFDLIYAYSIFTHLAEPVFMDILEEFSRIVKPNGFVALTTLPTTQIDVWQAERKSGEYARAIEHTDFDPVSWRARAEIGDFLYLPTGGAGPTMVPEIYGWAVISRACLERALQGTRFQLLSMGPVSGLLQECVLLRKNDCTF